ncbi:ATP-binding cassette domain-containing protein [Sphingomonas sp. CROZ-RG-20F-R02-07]|uniref:ABC transporter ATP-binding protein n=1 Tax=Sphingomonas sp. CROZ-RG-20F-R02-07 TaxID=2914832 RepID=UPI001F5752AD|nr:ATP-binding cassette domain-containing protein [Sphingomonas sp. CROZ-RG-20F-R02-07]
MTIMSVSGLSKKYCQSLRRSLRYGLQDIASELVGRHGSRGLRRDEFWALDDVSLSVEPGEALAVLGRNGAGKSTLLRTIYGILKPDRGNVHVRGRVGAIIELGTGLDPLLTGRENVALGAMFQGLDQRRHAGLLDEVVAFAELDAFIDSPLQSYSSGMRARLAYALAAHLKPDLLLVDEVLAVGDLAFQRKCVNHMRDYLAHGGTVLFISHNVLQIQAVCRNAVLLDHGRLVASGDVASVVNQMMEDQRLLGAEEQGGTGPVRICSISISAPDGGRAKSGASTLVTFECEAETAVDVVWGFTVWTVDQWVGIGGAKTPETVRLHAGRNIFTCLMPRLPLAGGRYAVRAAIIDPETHFPLAMYGYDARGFVLDVAPIEGRWGNLQMLGGLLTEFEVEWA